MRIKLMVFLVLVLAGCGQNDPKKTLASDEQIITIEGHLKNGNQSLVTLDLMGSTAFIPVDSVRCDKEGNFKLSFPANGMNFYSLKYTDIGYVTIIASPGDKISVRGDSETVYPYTIGGSKASELVNELAESHHRILEELREISEESERILGDPLYVEKKQSLNIRFDSITSAFQHYSRDFILNHPESPAILIALYNQYGPGLPVFNPLTDLEIYQFADSVLYLNYPENEAVQSLHSQLSAALQQLRNQENSRHLQKGDQAPDFVMKSIENKTVSLSEFRGKYVLLHFWASWSKPSMEENPFLHASHEKFSDKELMIVQVSIDSDEKAWKDAVREGYSNWIHISDLRRWESVIANLYRVERIPANFLIDPRGRIVEIDIFGEDLIEKLEDYLQ